MKKEKSCGAIVINNDKVLIVRQNSNFYGFPKGHVEKGETEVETAIREVKEETNVDIIIDENLRFTMNYITGENKVDKEVVLFIGYPKSIVDLIPQQSEIKSVAWIPISQVYDILSFDTAKELWVKVMPIIKYDN